MGEAIDQVLCQAGVQHAGGWRQDTGLACVVCREQVRAVKLGGHHHVLTRYVMLVSKKAVSEGLGRS